MVGPEVSLATSLFGVLSSQLACRWTRPSGHTWDPFVPGLLLTWTTGQSSLTGKQQETIDLSPLPSLFPLLNPSYPSPFFLSPSPGHRNLVEGPQPELRIGD